MKVILRNHLSQLGILPHIHSLRGMSEMLRWMQSGYTGPTPPYIKRRILKAYLHRFGLSQFIETGTYFGDTLAYLAHDKDINCTSIELAESYYLQAKARFAHYPNVRLLQGDSGTLLSSVVRQLNTPALFWLDGHYSGGTTSQGDCETSVSLELQSIFASMVKAHVILIDDVRYFDGSNGYPHLDDLLKTVRKQSNYCAEVSTDIIRLTPSVRSK